VDEVEFKAKYRQNVCAGCPKRLPCAEAESICELVTPCAVCEIRDICTSLCDQMKGYLNRGRKKEPQTISMDGDKLEGFYSYKASQQRNQPTIIRDKYSMTDVPWEILSGRDQVIVQKHFIEDVSYEALAEEFKLAPKTVYGIIYGSNRSKGALEKLREFGEYRRLLKKYGKHLSTSVFNTLKDHYIDLSSVKELKQEDESYRQAQYRLLQAKKLIDKFKEMEDN